MLLFDSITLDIISVVVALVIVVYSLFQWRYNYWHRKGVITLPPSIPFGHMLDLLLKKEHFAELWQRLYNTYKKQGLKFGGAYFITKPFFILVDLELIKSIMQKDFAHFMNHGGYINEKVDPLSGHLFLLEGVKWKNLRAKLTPTFTSGKMKMMFQTLADCAVGLVEIMDNAAKSKKAVDIKDVLGCFTTDIIGSCAFGLECNSLKNPDCEFRKYGKEAFLFTTFEKIRYLMIPFFAPRKLLKAFNYKVTKPGVEQFFMDIVKKNVEYREKNNIYRKDFMHLLIQLKNLGRVTDDDKISDGSISEKGLTVNEIAAQTFVFFIAGFETSSTLMTFAVYELAINKQVQDKLREEVKTILAKYDNKITYDAINEMTYMEKVCNETLRKYPPIAAHTRCCNKEYKVPDSDTIIEEGTVVIIPTLAIHYDPEYYPNPEQFDPERFSDESKKSRPAFTWLPFGEGPRICIGLRFGMMQSKVGLATLIQNYEISLNSKTQTPVVIDKDSTILSALNTIYVDVQKIED